MVLYDFEHSVQSQLKSSSKGYWAIVKPSRTPQGHPKTPPRLDRLRGPQSIDPEVKAEKYSSQRNKKIKKLRKTIKLFQASKS